MGMEQPVCKSRGHDERTVPFKVSMLTMVKKVSMMFTAFFEATVSPAAVQTHLTHDGRRFDGLTGSQCKMPLGTASLEDNTAGMFVIQWGIVMAEEIYRRD